MNNKDSNVYTFPKRYIPKNVTQKDKKIIKFELIKSKKNYKKGIYYTRKNIHSFKSKTSKHIDRAIKVYKVDSIIPNKELSKKTGCSVKSLKKIVNKGMGAYYSSGSRPNQTPQSWGRARLASAITGSKASSIDFDILQSGCNKNSKALKLAIQSKSYGRRKTPKIQVGGRNMKMKEKIIKFEKSNNHSKKYMAYIKNLMNGKIRILHFGASDYEQYKDRTPLKLYAHKNHNNKKRQYNYYSRHSHGITNRKEAINYEINKSNGYYNAKILSHIYLW
jgi:glutaredoxin